MKESWRFEWVEGDDEVLSPAFLQVWEGILRRSRDSNVFQEPLLARAWLETKGAALGLVPRFCRATSDSGAEVLVPFCQVPHGPRTAWRRRLVSLGQPHFDYQDPVSAWPSEGSSWSEFWPQLNAELSAKGHWEHAMLLRLGASASSPHTRPDSAHEAPVIRLEGRPTLDDVLKDRSANHRKEVRLRIRRLPDLGEPEFRVFGPLERSAAMEELRRLREAHERLWAGTHSQAQFRQPGTFAFYERLLESALPAGLVHFSVQLVAGRPISWHFGFTRAGTLHWYKPTYDKDVEAFSPGKVHLARLVQLGVHSGWREIDLGAGTEAYKYLWTKEARPLTQWGWTAQTWRARMYRIARRAYGAFAASVQASRSESS